MYDVNCGQVVSGMDEQKPKSMIEIIKEAGYVLVVQCKDCIYGDDFDCPAPLPTGYLCQKGHGPHTGNWFCADGERKEGW